MNEITLDLIKNKITNSDSLSQEKCDPDSTCAAILLPLILKNSDWHLLYTRRTGNVSSHQNEVSFPGGAFERADITLEHTALRETFEEIGVQSKDIKVFGQLHTSNTITGFKVFPFVGLVNWPVDLKINKEEVESVFSIPINWLADPANYYEAEFQTKDFGIRNVIHYKEYEGEHLWGYTARVTQQFLNVIK